MLRWLARRFRSNRLFIVVSVILFVVVVHVKRRFAQQHAVARYNVVSPTRNIVTATEPSRNNTVFPDRLADLKQELIRMKQTWRVPAPGDYHIPQVALNETHATVVMLTHNRTSVMLQTAEHFLSMGFISKVVILWNNIGLEPPTAELEQIEKNQGKSLVLKEFTENKIRLRFHLYKEIDTAAFFSVDDDLLITGKDMYHAFMIWKQRPHAVVGFTERGHLGSAAEGFIYDYLPKMHSIILTNAAYVHREYIRMYEENMPVAAHHLVDTLQNCEDIALNFLVSNYCRCPSAVFVRPRGKWVHFGQKTGLWKTGNHKEERDFCVDSLAHMFPALPQRSVKKY